MGDHTGNARGIHIDRNCHGQEWPALGNAHPARRDPDPFFEFVPDEKALIFVLRMWPPSTNPIKEQ